MAAAPERSAPTPSPPIRQLIAQVLGPTLARLAERRSLHMPAPKGTRPPAAGKGRPRGARNKISRELKEMILAALDKAGGEQYFVEQANTNPVAFLTLIGKVLPLQVSGEGGGPVLIVTGVPPGHEPDVDAGARRSSGCER
jgi:hypothetical protein